MENVWDASKVGSGGKSAASAVTMRNMDPPPETVNCLAPGAIAKSTPSQGKALTMEVNLRTLTVVFPGSVISAATEQRILQSKLVVVRVSCFPSASRRTFPMMGVAGRCATTFITCCSPRLNAPRSTEIFIFR
jgi:hypothetical protein